jgi:hypothetical protein
MTLTDRVPSLYAPGSIAVAPGAAGSETQTTSTSTPATPSVSTPSGSIPPPPPPPPPAGVVPPPPPSATPAAVVSYGNNYLPTQFKALATRGNKMNRQSHSHTHKPKSILEELQQGGTTLKSAQPNVCTLSCYFLDCHRTPHPSPLVLPTWTRLKRNLSS